MATKLREAFRINVDLSPSHDIGAVPTGTRRVIPIIGGTVTGRIEGQVIGVGADWNLARPDGVIFLSARYLLQTHDGATISILNEGWARLSDAAIGKIMAGEPAPDDGWYCKTHPSFEVADPRYKWLNETVFLGEMLPPPGPTVVPLVIYEVL